jgi:hypothetical protein
MATVTKEGYIKRVKERHNITIKEAEKLVNKDLKERGYTVNNKGLICVFDWLGNKIPVVQ